MAKPPESHSKSTSDLGFDWREEKNGGLLVSRHGRMVKRIAGRDARRLADKLSHADHTAQQQLLAKATGQYKFGNEREAKGRQQTRDGRE